MRSGKRPRMMHARMERSIEELHYEATALGELILRRRKSLSMPGTIVYEVKLDGAFLMSSLVREAEEALATLALRRTVRQACRVLIGGLGLGHTAEAALRKPNVSSVEVIEFLQPVIDWHVRRLVPASETLMNDPRCRLMQGDFFACVGGAASPMNERYDVILLDIDHAPDAVLDPPHAAFYTREGLARLVVHLRSGGIFALWSAERPGETFISAARTVFWDVQIEEIRYLNPNLGERESNWVLVCTLPYSGDAG